jgi:hypothetical protein
LLSDLEIYIIRHMSIEKQDLQWTAEKEGQYQIHKGMLLLDSKEDDFYKSITNLLQSLNSGEIIPEYPANYLFLDLGYLPQGGDTQLRFIVFKERDKNGTSTLVFPSPSVTEYKCFKAKGSVIISGNSEKLSFDMFKLNPKISSFMEGRIEHSEAGWSVESVFDDRGYGYDEYKETLSLLKCPVK